MPRKPPPQLRDEDFEQLADLRYALRRFLHWSGEQAREHGLTPAQHQLLLAVRASSRERGPTVGDVAEQLMLRHHSAVGLIDRAQDAGLIERRRDPEQHSLVRLRLTAKGRERLLALSEAHLRELAQLGPGMRELWRGLEASDAVART